MSEVTNILIIGIDAFYKMMEVNAWLSRHFRRGAWMWFHCIDQDAGGDKSMETNILASAINYFSRIKEEFILFLQEKVNWENPTDLFIQEQNDLIFKRIPLNYKP